MTGWIAFVLTTLGFILTAKKIIWCWVVLSAGNVFWIHNLWGNKPAVIIQFVFLGLNVYGWINWGAKQNVK